MIKSVFSDPKIFTISFLPRDSFWIGYYNIFLSLPMPILRAWEAHDDVRDANIILEGLKHDTDTTEFKCCEPAIQ